MRSATTAAQMTVGTTSTTLRTPTRPSGRGKPRNSGTGPLDVQRVFGIDRLGDASGAGVRPVQISAAAPACEVVRVHVRPGGNRRRRGPDRPHLITALGDGLQHDLVAARDRPDYSERLSTRTCG